MDFKNWFSNMFAKNSPSRQAIAVHRMGQAVSTPQNYEGFSREGYSKNVVAYKAITEIAQAVASLDLLVYRKRTGGSPMEVENHDALRLLGRPNPMSSGFDFMEALTAYILIAGNTYVEANGEDGRIPKELWVPRPDRMRIVPGSMGLPIAYEYRVSGHVERYNVDAVRGKSQILHMKTFNPMDDWYGMSPLQAASFSIDSNNEAGKWNLAMFQNMTTPSGAFVVQVSDNNMKGKLDDVQYGRLQKKLDEKMSGSANARKPILLEGGLDWKAMGLGPVDMDFLNSKNTTARDVALALGYPPLLLGIPGDSTFNNYREARMSLYEDTVLPMAKHILSGLNYWLMPAYGDGFYLCVNEDTIEALAPKREQKWKQYQESNFLTINEKRQAVGYDPVEGGDTLLVEASRIPLDAASSFSFDDDDFTDFEDEDDDDEKGLNVSPERKDAQSRFDDFITRYIRTRAATQVTNIQRRSKKVVVKAIRDALLHSLEDELMLPQSAKLIQKNVAEVYDVFSKSRSRTIARTEIGIASNEASRAAAQALQIPNLMKQWVSTIDHRSRGMGPSDSTNHIVMDGVKVGLNEKFEVPSSDGMDMMEGPGDPNAPAGQIINCRCVTVYSTEEKSLNLNSAAARRRYWRLQEQRKAALERRFAAQVSAYFRREKSRLIEALEDVSDVAGAEYIIESVYEETKQNLDQVFRANYQRTLTTFGEEILKLAD